MHPIEHGLKPDDSSQKFFPRNPTTFRAPQIVLPPLQRIAPVISSAALVQVLEHEKMMAKGARICIIVGDRVVISVQALF